LFLLSSVLVACQEGDELNAESVREVPPGDARGEAASGSYRFESYTARCSGACGPVTSGIFTYHFCDVGDRDGGRAEIVQREGKLRADIDENFAITRYEGGLNADASFELGGYGTQNGGQLEFFGHIDGFLEHGRIDATAEVRMQGTFENSRIDCLAIYEIEGERR
jgi:hypothetical protein